MTTHTIDQIHAVAPTVKPFSRMPDRLTANAVIGVLASLGLTIPTGIAAAAAKGEPLRASGHRFTVKEIDGALSKANVPLTDRFRFKEALDRNGVLGG